MLPFASVRSRRSSRGGLPVARRVAARLEPRGGDPGARRTRLLGYFATSMARDSRITITLTWPGYSS